jgi:tetratricopeptide (TPR) repeat protein
MKFFAAVAIALLLAIPAVRAQDNPDDQYVIIYTLIQQGDSYEDAGQRDKALADYQEAQSELQRFQTVYGDWNPKIVNFRLNYLAQKTAALTPPPVATNAAPATQNVAVVPAPVPTGVQSQVDSLNAQIRQLQADNDSLQNKLKEALGVQPATVSADAFAQVQSQVRDLAKQNELLKASLTQATNAMLASAQIQAALAQQTALAATLAKQNQSLQARVQVLTTEADTAEALREENALLKKEMAMGNFAPAPAAPVPVPVANNSGDLAADQRQIAQLQAQNTETSLEKAALENRIREMQEASVAAASVETDTNVTDLQSQIAELKLERDNLLAQLGEANTKLYGRKNQGAAAQIDDLAQQVETLRARVAVDEAQPVPFTAEEVALFQPETLTANPNAEKKSIKELPAGSAMLVAEAQNYFTNGEYDKAAADYQQILNHDQNNPIALANLASIEIQEDKIADADKHITTAVAQAPDDAFNLAVLGHVKFAEGNYDAALDALDRAAKLDPQNPQVQNFLGVALAQKGLRTQAETAFRKAVEIDPEYGDAHKNLAIIYLSAQPPEVELARWHYEKALAAGMPPNADLEKMLSEAGAHSQP